MKSWVIDTPGSMTYVEAERWFVGDWQILYFTSGEGKDLKQNAAFREWNFVAEDTDEDNAE